MLFLLLVGVIALVFGVLFLFYPQALRKANEVFSRQISFEQKILDARKGVGIFLLVSAALVFSAAYYIFLRYGR